jgi:hypothetical protein
MNESASSRICFSFINLKGWIGSILTALRGTEGIASEKVMYYLF